MKKTTFPFLFGIILVISSCRTNTDVVHSEMNNGMIPIDSANKMIGSYLNSMDPGVAETISLLFDAETLRTYLEDPQITGLKFMLAHPLEYINEGNENVNGGLKSGALTIVIGGFDRNGNYVLGPGRTVPNKARICPPYCSVDGNTADNLLQ